MYINLGGIIFTLNILDAYAVRSKQCTLEQFNKSLLTEACRAVSSASTVFSSILNISPRSHLSVFSDTRAQLFKANDIVS